MGAGGKGQGQGARRTVGLGAREHDHVRLWLRRGAREMRDRERAAIRGMGGCWI